MRTALPVLLFASLISLSVLAEDEGHMRPFKREMLLKPIEISECSMKILEWRPKKNDKQTKPNQKNIDIVISRSKWINKGQAVIVCIDSHKYPFWIIELL